MNENKTFFYGTEKGKMWWIDTLQLGDARVIPHVEELLEEDLIDASREQLEQILRNLLN